MSVVSIDSWRLPGCSNECAPRRHDPYTHEAYGRILEREDAAGRIVRTGPLVIDLEGNRVEVDGSEVHLSPTEWRLLSTLARSIGRTVSTTDIIAAAWGDEYLDETGYALQKIKNTTLCRLRSRLGAAGHLIVTVLACGLRLESDERAAVRIMKMPRWARDWDACEHCRSTDRPHVGRGLCSMCRSRQQRGGKFL